jgi:hypothetical protein
MEHMFKKFLSLSLLVSTGAVLADNCNTNCNNDCDAPAKPITCFVPRSQSFHNELKNAAMDPDNQFLYDVDGFNGSFNIMFEYDHTFNSDKLGKCLFGQAAICVSGCDDDAVALRVVGSAAATAPNGTTDLVADNFFLPKDFSSTIIVKPSIQNFNVHLQAYFGFDEWCTGLYARIYAPITVSKWKLETTETFGSKGTTPAGDYATGEIAPVAVTNADLNDSFLAYTQGGADYTLPGFTATNTVPAVAGPTVQALKYTRFGSCESDSTTQLADLRAELGWNFLLDEDYHLGLYIAAAAPTANDCEDDCNTLLWGAKAGNGAHWELGGGLTAHYTMWRAEDCEQQFDFFVDATINHMFAHTERRTFDLKNKPLSRYIIAEKLTSTITNSLTVGGNAATYQFAGAYAPVANLTTQDVSVSFPVQADVMAKFVYTCKGFSWALGYDFWAQACPNVSIDNCNDDCDATPAFAEKTWALRGNAHVYGFRNGGTSGANDLIQPIPATFNANTAFVLGNAYGTGLNNGSVDGTPAATNAGGELFNAPAVDTAAILGSTTPTFITATDIDINNVTRGLSNSIFTEMNYTWIDRECWVPYLGIGARVEFGSNGSGNNNNTTVTTTTTTNNCNNDCNNCDTCTATVWGIWIKGGLSFN